MNKEEVLMRCNEVSGWMYNNELLWLFEQAQGKKIIVEIGVWQGRSTTALCLGTSGTVFAIDHWKGSPDELDGPHQVMKEEGGREKVMLTAMKNLRPFIEKGSCVPVYCTSSRAFSFLAPYLKEKGGANMIFIDAGHDYSSVASDISLWKPLLANGGIICGHDYHWPGVGKAVKEQYSEPTRGPGSIWYVEALSGRLPTQSDAHSCKV